LRDGLRLEAGTRQWFETLHHFAGDILIADPHFDGAAEAPPPFRVVEQSHDFLLS
jgi:hypothetical protein